MFEEKEDVFYLGFNKETGQLVDVIPPKDKQIKLHPQKAYMGGSNQMRGEEKPVLEQIKSVHEWLRESGLPPSTIRFYDHPAGSICGGSVGGIPFKWCP